VFKFHGLTLVSSCALARLSTAIAKNTLSNVSVQSIVKNFVSNLQHGFHVQQQNLEGFPLKNVYVFT